MANLVQGLLRRPWRIAAIIGAIIVVGLIAIALRTLSVAGVFDDVKPQFAGTCKTIPGVIGAEDIQVDHLFNLAFISATDRRAPKDKPNPQDGIYVMHIDHPELGVVKMAGTPADFHPHGISLYRGRDGALVLMVVNHPTDGPQRSRFSTCMKHWVLAAKSARPCITAESGQGPLLVSPNDVVAVGSDRFYATNDHTSHTTLGVLAETWLLLPRANVVYYDGDSFKVAADDLRYANGINVSPDMSHIYVAQTTGQAIRTYARDVLSGALKVQGDFEFPSGLDNIDVAPNGDLWVADHPKLLSFLGYARDPSSPSPSQVMRVRVEKSLPVEAVPVYTNLGEQIGAASVGAVAGKHLLIGSVFDPKILDCTLP